MKIVAMVLGGVALFAAPTAPGACETKPTKTISGEVISREGDRIEVRYDDGSTSRPTLDGKNSRCIVGARYPNCVDNPEKAPE